MKNKLLTIIIPAFNAENCISRCLDSILCQIDDSIEMVIINDSSTDGTGGICDDYQKKHPDVISVFHNDHNRGPSYSRNRGIMMAKADYIIFIDSDDYLTPRAIVIFKEELFNPINNDVDVFEYGFNVYRNGRYERSQNTIKNDSSMKPEDYLLSALTEYTYEWYAWKYIFKKKLFLDIDCLFPEGVHYEDVYVIPHILLKAKKIKSINHIVYNYMLGTPGAITTGIKVQTEIDKINSAAHSITESENVTNNHLRQLLQANFSILYYSALIVLYGIRDLKDRENLYRLLRDNKKITYYSLGMRYSLINICINILGIKLTSRLLFLRMRMKNARD